MYDPDKLNPFPTRNDLAFEGATAFSLRVILRTRATTNIMLRGYTKDGVFTHRISPAGDDSNETFDFRMTDIPVAVTLSPATLGSGSFVAHAQVYLMANDDPMILLAQGRIGSLRSISWPHAVNHEDLWVVPPIEFITLENPAAGSELDFTLANNESWELIAVQFTYVADANAANRTVALRVSNSVGDIFEIADGTAITAAQTRQLCFIRAGTTAVTGTDLVHVVGLPDLIEIPSGSQIRTKTTNKQAGDNIGTVTAQIRRRIQTES